MKPSLLLLAVPLLVVLFFGVAFSDEWVNGYYRKDGTYVQGYHRSSPDGNPYNNYSTRGNVNPYTGQKGYKDPSNSYTNPNNINPYNTNPYNNPNNNPNSLGNQNYYNNFQPYYLNK
jgi:hypothetical protein